MRSSVLQFGDSWHQQLDLMEFAYNNSFHSSIGMAPFEALYGKPCRTPLCWSEVGERVLEDPKIVKETTQNGYDGIWVIVDRLTKSAHFIPVREKFSLNRLAELFIPKIVKYHGVPVSIVSDCDPRFTSKFWIAF